MPQRSGDPAGAAAVGDAAAVVAPRSARADRSVGRSEDLVDRSVPSISLHPSNQSPEAHPGFRGGHSSVVLPDLGAAVPVSDLPIRQSSSPDFTPVRSRGAVWIPGLIFAHLFAHLSTAAFTTR